MYFIIDNYFICLNKAIKGFFSLEYVLQIFKIKNYCSQILKSHEIYSYGISNIKYENNLQYFPENNIELKLINHKECKKRYSPESSFKFALSLIGFDSLILKDSSNPKWKINNEKLAFFSFHKNDQTPKTWMRDSAVWYSKILTDRGVSGI